MDLIVVKAAPAGAYIAFAIALYIWHVAAALLGVFIADYFAVSDSSPELKKDLKKMSVCSLIALSSFLAIFYFAQKPIVFVIYILFLIFSLKVAYLGSNHGFLLIILGTAMAAMIAFAVVVKWMRLPGIFFLYLVFLIVFLIRQQIKKKKVKEIKEIEKRKEHTIRNQVRRNRNFTTFCYQCLFYRQASGRCQLKIDGEDVQEIAIAQRTYCTSFQQNPAGPLRADEHNPS